MKKQGLFPDWKQPLLILRIPGDLVLQSIGAKISGGHVHVAHIS
jgi:hypothetical protein